MTQLTKKTDNRCDDIHKHSILDSWLQGCLHKLDWPVHQMKDAFGILPITALIRVDSLHCLALGLLFSSACLISQPRKRRNLAIQFKCAPQIARVQPLTGSPPISLHDSYHIRAASLLDIAISALWHYQSSIHSCPFHDKMTGCQATEQHLKRVC
jgi:hypothetical protein